VKLSTRGRYGVRALFELARQQGQGPVPINVLASHQEISAKYLEQLLIPLKAAGLVSSVRGARGGYLLSRPPEDISLYDVVAVLEGPLTVVECVENPDSCQRQGGCAVHLLWDEMSLKLKSFLSDISLADLLARSRQAECEVKDGLQEAAL
jgi:Rrf2 family protein